MTIEALLAEHGLRSAVIVDDAADEVPRAEDLAANTGGWEIFFDDIGNDLAHITAAFPNYEAMSAEELRRSDAFIRAVWEIRARLRPDLTKELFGPYDTDTRADRAFLLDLKERLKALGVNTEVFGRDGIPNGGTPADIVFVDLFLGAAQRDPDMERSISLIASLLEQRKASPPVVILMSRSPLLADKRVHFRDKAKLIGAFFRLCSKADLQVADRLNLLLSRLARHYTDARKVAAFLQAWEAGLRSAADRFLAGMRRLDLTDYAQIREVLLNVEKQPLGSYMLDVFDRVLQHEIEGDEATIASAEKLNTIDGQKYPAPSIAGIPDLQHLVFQTIWQNPRRLSVKTTVAGVPVGLGDLLVRRELLNVAVPADANPNKSPEALDGKEEGKKNDDECGDVADVLLVVSAACDLMRPGPTVRALMLAGTVTTLDSSLWLYGADEVAKTAIVELQGTHYCIRWNLKDARLIPLSKVENLISQAGPYQLTLRMRESHALELQQRLLSRFSRVGVLANMPATFSVDLTAHYVTEKNEWADITLPDSIRRGCVCYVGQEPATRRLVMTEEFIDELLQRVASIPDDGVPPKALPALQRVRARTELARLLEHGVNLPEEDGKSAKLKLIEGGDLVVGQIIRNPDKDSQAKQFAPPVFLLKFRDKPIEAANVPAAANNEIAKKADVVPTPVVQETAEAIAVPSKAES